MISIYKDQLNQEQVEFIRCRSSPLTNFNQIVQWQILFEIYPNGFLPSQSNKIHFDLFDKSKSINIFTWYNLGRKLTIILNKADNFRRRSLSIIDHSFISDEILFDLDRFLVFNKTQTIRAHLRWIPFIVNQSNKKFQFIEQISSNNIENLHWFTIDIYKSIKTMKNSSNIIEMFDIENGLVDINGFDLKYRKDLEQTIDKSMTIRRAFILDEKTDLVVIFHWSNEEIDRIKEQSNKEFIEYYSGWSQSENLEDQRWFDFPINKKLYNFKKLFIYRFPLINDKTIVDRLIVNLFADLVDQLNLLGMKTLSLPPIDFKSEEFLKYSIEKYLSESNKYKSIDISLIVHPENEYLIEFIEKIKSKSEFLQDFVSINFANSTIVVEKGNFFDENSEIIVGNLCSIEFNNLILDKAGPKTKINLQQQIETNKNDLILCTPAGELKSKLIFFFNFKQNQEENDEEKFDQSVEDLVWIFVRNVQSHQMTNICLPSIIYHEKFFNRDRFIEKFIEYLKKQILKRKLSWNIRFLIEQDRDDLFDEFVRQIVKVQSNDNYPLLNCQFPSNWRKSTIEEKSTEKLFLIERNSSEYKNIVDLFDRTMKGLYKKIQRIERIENRRWFIQYFVHRQEFQQRLRSNTERILFHGCPQKAAFSIIEECFNRSFAGIHGVSFGCGVYFSSDANYSHRYSLPNDQQEHFMFVVQVLIGKTTLGNPSMKTRPIGFDSTTNGTNIFVTYHDAQAYAQYLIIYK